MPSNKEQASKVRFMTTVEYYSTAKGNKILISYVTDDDVNEARWLKIIL